MTVVPHRQDGLRGRRNAVYSVPYDDVFTRRWIIHASEAMMIEDSARAVHDPIASGYSHERQIVVPYFGAFRWRVTGNGSLVDLNTVLLVAGGEEFAEAHPSPTFGHGSLILTPAPELADEIDRRATSAGCAAGIRPCSAAVRLDTHILLSSNSINPLAVEEIAIRVMAGAVGRAQATPAARAARLIERAKEALICVREGPMSLSRIAREVGVSPVHLTQTFTSLTGMPLYRYQRQLRLARALFELPGCGNLTDLALELGFSSHAHFSTAFRATYGVTPSQLRRESRAR